MAVANVRLCLYLVCEVNTVIRTLVRVQDRLTVTRDAAPVWRINPRTGTLDARAGLSWTGIRPYRTASGVVRVLRRPEQVNSEGHRKTLHRLPQPEGHPAGDVNIGPENIEALNCGWTGDAIDVETLGGYARPVGNMSVFRVSTIANMVDDATWEEYCELFPDVVGTAQHTVGNRPRTGTSLGYNALWYGPHVESEIVSERDGVLVGAWQGPNGPEEYDIEHIVDPDCEIVQRLKEEVGFKPEMLGANHNAIGLQALGGRGAEQAELMRIVDSRSLPITADQSRALTRVALQVNRVKTRDAAWTVGTDRDLDIVSGDWDGDKAARSVFDWAGWPDAPKPEQARRAFLIYDADAPELIGSYKLPIAEYRDGGLVVVDSALRAAASYLPQTDAPQEVLDRARAVLDHYFARKDEAAARDSAASNASKVRTMNKKVFEFGIGRDNARTLAKLGLDKFIVQDLALTLDEIDADKLHAKLMEMQGMFADLMQMVGEAKSDAEGMKAQMTDMMSVAEATAMVDKVKAQLAEAEQALAAAKASEETAVADACKTKKMADELAAELAPYKEAEFQQLCADAIAAGCDANKVADCKDAAALRRHVVLTHPKLGEAKYGKASDDVIAAAFDGIWAARPAVAIAPALKPTPTNDAAGRTSTLAGVPTVSTQRVNDSAEAPKLSTADEMDG